MRRAALLPLCLAAAAFTACWASSKEDPKRTAATTSEVEAKKDDGPVTPEADRCAAKHAGRWHTFGAKQASSSLAVAKAGDREIVIVADEDERALHVIDGRSLAELSMTELEGRPKHVLVLEDGRIAVTLRDKARVVLFEAGETPDAALERRCDAEVAAEPWGIAEAKDALFVTSAFGAQLTMFRSSDLGIVDEVKLPREPRSVLVDPSQRTVYVSHAVGGVVSAVDLAEPRRLTKISVKAGQKSNGTPRESTQGYALASITLDPERGSEGWRLLVPETSVDPGVARDGISTGGYGSVARPVAPLISVVTQQKQSITQQVSQVERGTDCLLPRAAVVRGFSVLVACADIDAVVEYDAHLASPADFVVRSAAVPPGPTGLALDGDANLFVWSEIAHQLTRVDLDNRMHRNESMEPRRRAAQPSGETNAQIIRGRALFHTSRDKRLADSRACASCHPEGRDDGVVWTSPDGPRQTPVLAGKLVGTAPYGWFGESPTLRDHLSKTFSRLGGSGLNAHDEGDFEALVAYISSLPAPPTSRPRDEALAERGKSVFALSGCGSCHSASPTGTAPHNVGTGSDNERTKSFDTPALIGIRGSAPYFHDGRYPTLEALLEAKDNTMLGSHELTPADRVALRAYLDEL